jgi:hypothetical protein
MSKTEEQRVWWTDHGTAHVRGQQVKPYFADVSLENDMLEEMGELNMRLLHNPQFPIAFDDSNRPDELRWFYSKVPDKARNLPDAFMGHMGAIIISEAFHDVITQFDLGGTQIFELPLYELSAMTKMGRSEPDRSKQDPRRWFLFHVTDFKDCLRVEASENLIKRPVKAEVYTVSADEEKVVAIDGAVAAQGPDIWMDRRLRNITFYSDPLKRAIEAAKLRTPIIKFQPCRIV